MVIALINFTTLYPGASCVCDDDEEAEAMRSVGVNGKMKLHGTVKNNRKVAA